MKRRSGVFTAASASGKPAHTGFFLGMPFVVVFCFCRIYITNGQGGDIKLTAGRNFNYSVIIINCKEYLSFVVTIIRIRPAKTESWGGN